jgi:Cof subfamily protein (haloacid dehalogenase superfamily)
MRFSLIALDLDDTLLHTDLSISEANRTALREAHRKSAKVVLASGRNLFSMEKYAVELGLAGEGDYLIATNGAEIVETMSARILSEKRLAPALCREIIELLASRGLPWQVYIGGKILYQGRNPWTEEDTRLTGQPNSPVPDQERIIETGQLKILVPGEPAMITALHVEMAPRFAGRAEVIISKPYFLEFLARGVDKGQALGELAGLLGIPLEATLAMGDAMNDLGMLRAAGFSCAPANALPSVKAAAGWVSPLSNDEDFVADALARWLPS